MTALFHNVGDSYKDFILLKRHDIKELKLVMQIIEHKGTGAKIMHLDADDPENLFCLSFQTLPSSSNGAAHILEHTVLCGSKKFPVKDPFFTMQKRSLNTFMNAFTGSDFTCYPASSLNKKAFSYTLALLQMWYLLFFKFRKSEVVFVSVPPMGYLLNLLLPNRFSMIIWDVYPDVFKITGMKETHPLYRIWSYLNKKS